MNMVKQHLYLHICLFLSLWKHAQFEKYCKRRKKHDQIFEDLPSLRVHSSVDDIAPTLYRETDKVLQCDRDEFENLLSELNETPAENNGSSGEKTNLKSKRSRVRQRRFKGTKRRKRRQKRRKQWKRKRQKKSVKNENVQKNIHHEPE